MKIIKGLSETLILSGCTLEKNYRDENTCHIKFFGGGGTFSNDCTIFEISKSYDDVLKFLESSHKIFNTSFHKVRHNE